MQRDEIVLWSQSHIQVYNTTCTYVHRYIAHSFLIRMLQTFVFVEQRLLHMCRAVCRHTVRPHELQQSLVQVGLRGGATASACVCVCVHVCVCVCVCVCVL